MYKGPSPEFPKKSKRKLGVSIIETLSLVIIEVKSPDISNSLKEFQFIYSSPIRY